MESILQQLADHARERVEQDKKNISPMQMELWAEMQRQHDFKFSDAIRDRRDGGETALICEIKKASPSKGIIDPVFDYKAILNEYEEAGADCISCLTEPKWFMGSDKIFSDLRNQTDVPMIRKDFVVDEYQIFQACCMGADAVLLICTLMDDEDMLADMLDISSSLGMDALVEAHNEDEVRMAVNAGASMIGVNNRDLNDFSIDLDNAKRLRELVPDQVIFVAESGIRNADDVAAMHSIGANAVLVGEALMRAENKRDTLLQMKMAAGQRRFKQSYDPFNSPIRRRMR